MGTRQTPKRRAHVRHPREGYTQTPNRGVHSDNQEKSTRQTPKRRVHIRQLREGYTSDTQEKDTRQTRKHKEGAKQRPKQRRKRCSACFRARQHLSAPCATPLHPPMQTNSKMLAASTTSEWQLNCKWPHTAFTSSCSTTKLAISLTGIKMPKLHT